MENKLWYRQEASVFEEALPLGNGAFGAMVYGKTKKERISLNLDTLWTGKPEYYDPQAEKSWEYQNPQAAESFEKARRLILADKVAEAEEAVAGKFYGMWPFSYLPMASLFVEREQRETRDYYRELDLEKAICSAKFGGTENEVFISNPDNVLVYHEKSKKATTITLSLACELQHSIRFENGIMLLSGRCPTGNGNSWQLTEVPFTYEENGGITFTLALTVQSDGDISFTDHAITICNAKVFTVYAAAKSSYVGYNQSFDETHEAKCLEILNNVVEKEYAVVKKEHILDHSGLYNLTKLDLNSKKSDLPTDVRLRSKECHDDLGLVELLWAFGKYLTIAASRKGSEATNLQGIWNEWLHAAFFCDYAVNINLQMNYWPTLMLGLNDCYEPLISFVKDLAVAGRQTAKMYYNADGFCAHGCVDLWRKTTPPGAGHDYAKLYAFWNLASGWIATHLFEYYEYTQDIAFLKNTAYDILKEACKFYLSIITFKDGEYLLAPTTSPENRYLDENNKERAFTKKAAMSQAIMKELFMDTLKAAEILNVDADFQSVLRDRISHIYPHVIGSDGRLMEWDREYKEHEVEHRHISHLYGLFPGNQITVEETPKLVEAAKKSLEVRGDEGTGWSRAWKTNFWAKLKDGDRALRLIFNQLNFVDATGNKISENGGTYANMMDAHPPFQIDGNLGAAVGIMQLFLQHECGKIKILPAIPSQCADGEITGFKTKGNVTVSVFWQKHKAKKVTLISPIAQSVLVEVGSKTENVMLQANKTCVLEI